MGLGYPELTRCCRIGSNLDGVKQRVITAGLLIPPVLAAIFAAAVWPICLLAAAAWAIGVGELQRLLKRPQGAIAADAMIGLAVTFALARATIGFAATAFIIAAGTAVGVAATWLCARTDERPYYSFFASGWIAGPLAALLALHSSPRVGTPLDGSPMSAPALAEGIWRATPVLLAIVPLWGGDTAAIFAGRAFGKHPLAPAISPKKTWEGSIANLFACIAVAVPLALWIGRSWSIGLACGFAAGTFGQAGDLFESYMKRQAGVKDSGALLPGHGGLLDRIDSILFTAPAVAMILALTSYWP